MFKRLGIALAGLALFASIAYATTITLTGAGGRTAASPIALTFQTSAINTSSLSTYAFLSQSLGAAASGRRVFVGIGYSNSGPSITSVTVGVVTCALVSDGTNNAGSLGGNGGNVFIYVCDNATDTTATVTVVLSGSAGIQLAIGIWTALGMTTDTAIAANFAIGGSSSLSTTLGTITGASFVIAFVGGQFGSAAPSWTAAAVDFTQVANSRANSGAHTNTPSSATISATASGSNLGSVIAAAAY